MGASQRQRLTAAAACEATEHQPRAKQIVNPDPPTPCQPPPSSSAEMNTSLTLPQHGACGAVPIWPRLPITLSFRLATVTATATQNCNKAIKRLSLV